MAADWDENHDFKTPVSRQHLQQGDELLHQLVALKHPNVLEVRNFCACTVEVEYLDAWLFNSHKPEWILFHEANQPDFLDTCSEEELFPAIRSVLDGLKALHRAGILHTDLTDANVMVRKDSRKPIIIDLLGSIPAGSQVFDEHRDLWVFVHFFLVPTLGRTGRFTEAEIVSKFALYTWDEMEAFLEEAEHATC